MTLPARLLAALSAFVLCLFGGLAAHAAGLEPLSNVDAGYYAAAFAATDRGDFDAAQAAFANTRDKSLAGPLGLTKLMHPQAYSAPYGELTGWLGSYGDQAGAERVYALALKRKPARVAAPKAPALYVKPGTSTPDKARAAREAYYSGDVKKALTLASKTGELWIAGLASFRLQAFPQARGFFERVARDGSQDEWLRSAAAFWAARAAEASGVRTDAHDLLRLAAGSPETFYGMIAARQISLAGEAAQNAADPIAELLAKASHAGPDVVSLNRLLTADPRARRAAALAQIGRWTEAGQELRAGLTLAANDRARGDWTALTLALNAKTPAKDAPPPGRRRADDHPLPPLAPQGGFTIDKAMVYALVRQESRFNPLAVSGAGAVGLMQLTPEAAARAAGDDKLKSDNSPLLDPGFNLRVGQDYFTWLMDRGLQSTDVLRTVAAYNGGPATLLRTAQQLGEDCDSLLLIESLPAQETRNYVERVMASYWTYRKLMGAETRTLDAVASGARQVDFRLDQ
ncbi:MAG: lytic transglycosylase [Caulobacter sp.]|nr:lytic transglycosylase [Caulobacter sp.]